MASFEQSRLAIPEIDEFETQIDYAYRSINEAERDLQVYGNEQDFIGERPADRLHGATLAVRALSEVGIQRGYMPQHLPAQELAA